MMTASELKIEQWEFDALCAVRNFLNLQRPQLPEDLDTNKGLPLAGTYGAKFCMSYGVQEFACGTAMCIGGYVKAFQLGVALADRFDITNNQASRISQYVSQYRYIQGIGELYYPQEDVDYNRITPEDAVMAIDNFLATGDPKWEEVLG